MIQQTTCFMISFLFLEKLRFYELKRFEIPILVIAYCEGALMSSKLQILRPYATAQMLLVSEI